MPAKTPNLVDSQQDALCRPAYDVEEHYHSSLAVREAIAALPGYGEHKEARREAMAAGVLLTLSRLPPKDEATQRREKNVLLQAVQAVLEAASSLE